MGLDRSLKEMDLTKVEAAFDDIFATNPRSEEADIAFLEGEKNFAHGTYPVFNLIQTKFMDVIPAMKEAGNSREQILGIMTGMDMMAMILSACASSEVPDDPQAS